MIGTAIAAGSLALVFSLNSKEDSLEDQLNIIASRLDNITYNLHCMAAHKEADNLNYQNDFENLDKASFVVPLEGDDINALAEHPKVEQGVMNCSEYYQRTLVNNYCNSAVETVKELYNVEVLSDLRKYPAILELNESQQSALQDHPHVSDGELNCTSLYNESVLNIYTIDKCSDTDSMIELSEAEIAGYGDYPHVKNGVLSCPSFYNR
jgi:hypothetical protein